MKILVIDDHVLIREALQGVLRNGGVMPTSWKPRIAVRQ